MFAFSAYRAVATEEVELPRAIRKVAELARNEMPDITNIPIRVIGENCSPYNHVRKSLRPPRPLSVGYKYKYDDNFEF